MFFLDRLPVEQVCRHVLRQCGDEGGDPVLCRAGQQRHRLVPDQTWMGQPSRPGEHRIKDHRRQWVRNKKEILTFNHVYCNLSMPWFWFFCFLSSRETQGKISVGKDRSRGHGCPSTGMIIVQRGGKGYMCAVMVEEAALTSAVCHSHAEGGCWALLSQVPAAGSWGSSVCRGQREHRQRTGLLQEILRWEGVRGSEGLFLTCITWNMDLEEIIKCFFYNITLEKFLWASREVDVSVHVLAHRCMEEPLEGLPEGARWEPERWRTGFRWSLCDWKRTAGRQ